MISVDALFDEEPDTGSVSSYGASHQIPLYRYQEHVTRFSTALDREGIIEQYQDYIEGLQRTYKCVSCLSFYQPIINFQVRECFVHLRPFPVVDCWTGLWVYECCQRPLGANGCVSSTHFTDEKIRLRVIGNYLDKQNMISVPCELIDQDIIPHSKELIVDLLKEPQQEFYHIPCLATDPIFPSSFS